MIRHLQHPIIPAYILAMACLVLPFAATAGAQFIITYDFVDGVNGNERVTVYLAPGDDMFGCTQNGLRCTHFEALLRVTPCPSGYYCPDGYYETTVDTYGAIGAFAIFLDLGTSYEFSGTWYRSVGYDTNPCEFTCFYEEPIDPTLYQTKDPADIGRWEVTTLDVDADTVWVLATPNIPDRDPGGCGSGYDCFYESVYLDIEPCPLRIRGVPGGSCPGAGGPPGLSREVGLEPGVDYVFGGTYEAAGDSPSPECFVGEPLCRYRVRLVPVAYSQSATAAQSSTWGRIKALYVDE